MSDKQATLQQVESAYQELREAVEGLKDDQLTRAWYGDWSVRDIVAHVLGWEREMTAALRRIVAGERPTPEGADYSDFNTWNARFAAEMQQISPGTVLAMWRQVHGSYIRAARAVPDDRYGEAKTVNKLLEASGHGHYREHIDPIREWRQREGI